METACETHVEEKAEGGGGWGRRKNSTEITGLTLNLMALKIGT